MNEDALGMSLNNALNTRNVDLGIELRAMRSTVMALYPALTGKLCNRHYPKLRNRHGNIHAAILNGATMLTTVW